MKLQANGIWPGMMAWSLSGMVFLVGCGDGSLPAYSVSGKVTLPNGNPVVGAGVRAESLDTKGNAKRITSHGLTGADGTYKLTTFKLDDGAVAGKHVVAIDNPVDFVKASKPRREPDDPDLIAKERLVIDVRYSDFTTSGLTLEVAATKDGNTGKDFVVDPYRR